MRGDRHRPGPDRGCGVVADTERDDVRLGIAGEPTSAERSVYQIRPGEGIGPVHIGMSRAEAARAMKRTDHAAGTIRRWPTGSTLTFPTLGISLWRMVVENTPRFETVLVASARRATDRRPARAAP